MKKFLLKLCLFIVMILVINQILLNIKDFHFGNAVIPSKMPFFQKQTKNQNQNQNQKFNTLFIGSSMTYRQINPAVFDRILSEKIPIKSFNLGAPSTRNPEIYYLYENLLKDKDLKLKYVFMELLSFHKIPRKNLHTINTKYFLTFNYYLYSVASALYTHLSSPDKLTTIRRYTICFLDRLFCIGMYGDIFKSPDPDPKTLGKNRDGFYSLDEEIMESENNQDLFRRKSIFESQTPRLSKRAALSKKSFSQPPSRRFFNKTHYNKVMDLIHKSRQKGIHLIFIIPPRLKFYKDVYSIFLKIPPNHKINLANAKEYPEFYKVEYSFDIGHLNKKGANLFTKILAQKFLELQLIQAP